MSPQSLDPFDPPPRHPSSKGGTAGNALPTEPEAQQQSTPQQPYDQQTPWGYRHPGHPQPDQARDGYGQQPYPGPPPQPGQPYPQQPWSQPGHQPQRFAPVSPSDEKLWALLSHLSIPFFGFVVPLVVYLVFKERSAWLKDSALEALNFSIFYTIAITASGVLTAVLVGLLLMPLVWVGAVVFCVVAALAANKHEQYRYPVNWRLVT